MSKHDKASDRKAWALHKQMPELIKVEGAILHDGMGTLDHDMRPVCFELSSMRMQQSRSAFRDKSPFLEFGTARGVQARYNLSLAPDAGQIMGLTVEDLKTHLFLFGRTGTGMTAPSLTAHPAPFEGLSPDDIEAILRPISPGACDEPSE